VPRVRLATIATAIMCLSLLLPAPAFAAAPSLSTRVIQSGLVIPWDLDFAPTGQMFVTERPGRIRVYASAKPGAALLATSTINGVRAEGEAGLMGIAVDHNFASNRLIYICVSRTSDGQWRNQVMRYHVRGDWKVEFDRWIIRYGMRANTIHNGCAVEEGPDQKIWVTMGDSNNAMLAQDPDRLNGKVLRVNRDGSVPSDNPIWPGDSAPTLVWSIGHRNPQGIAFQPGTNRVYVVEHGPEKDDEINWVRPGRNYGWPCRTGNNHPYQSCSGGATYIGPAWSSEGPTLATSGGTFVTGSIWESWQNNLFVSTLKHSDVRRYTPQSGSYLLTMQATLFNEAWGRLRASVLGPGNQLFVTTSNGSNDRVVRITPH
jgi:glucose/arabinose dehydrogenase